MEVAEQCVHLLLSEVLPKLIARANLLLWRWPIIWEALEFASLLAAGARGFKTGLSKAE
jgi:hypothetical protein